MEDNLRSLNKPHGKCAVANARFSVRRFIKDLRIIRARVEAGVTVDATEEDWQKYFDKLWSSYRRAVADARVPPPIDYQIAAATRLFGMLQQITDGEVDRP